MRRAGGVLWMGLILLAGKVSGQEAQRQETTAVLMPGNYLEDDRKPFVVGTMAPEAPVAACGLSAAAEKIVREGGVDKWLRNGRRRGTLVVYWGFWCDTWKDMTYALDRMRPRLRASGIEVAAIAVDSSQQDVLRPAVADGRVWWPVFVDDAGEAGKKWRVRRVPTMFLLDEKGTVVRVWEGFPGERVFWAEAARGVGVPVIKKRGK